jgi:hypothetical protein
VYDRYLRWYDVITIKLLQANAKRTRRLLMPVSRVIVIYESSNPITLDGDDFNTWFLGLSSDEFGGVSESVDYRSLPTFHRVPDDVTQRWMEMSGHDFAEELRKIGVSHVFDFSLIPEYRFLTLSEWVKM